MLTKFFRRSKPTRKPVKLNLVALEAREVPATFTVSSTLDAGAGSLRQAISGANGSLGSDTIEFNASFDTARTITLASELIITDGVVIRGPGSELLTVQGNDTFRLMSLDAAVGKAQTLNISGVTLTKGKGPGISGEGGAIRLQDESLLAIDVRFLNHDADRGGAVYADFSEVNPFMNFRDCVFEGNSGRYGAAVYSGGDRDVTLLNCTATGNTATDWGAAVCVNGDGGDLAITGSTFTGNTASIGGAISTTHSGDVFITDSLFNSNTATAYGGAISIHSWSDPGSWVIRNTTISNNSAATGGGAVTFASFFGIPDTLRVENSTITGNTGGTRAGGLFVYGDVSAESSIITGNTATAKPDVDVEDAVTLKNSVLGNTAGAVIVNDGGNFLAMSPAQIKLGSLADNGGTRLSHALAVDSPLLNKGSNPAGTTTDARGDGFPRSANGGVDIGSYERNLTFVVTNDNDSGAGSLRQALADADTSVGTNDIVSFDPVFFSTPRTIVLANQIKVTESVEIHGPDTAFATITAPTSRSLMLNHDFIDGSTGDVFLVSGLTFADNESSSNGGVIFVSDASLTVRDSVFRNATATLGGFGGAILGQETDLLLERCTFTGNEATLNGGGAVYIEGNTIIRDSTFDGNSAGFTGGAVYFIEADVNSSHSLLIENCTFSKNTSDDHGGGLGLYSVDGLVTIRNSTLPRTRLSSVAESAWSTS